MFDNLLDICNSLYLAYKLFTITNNSFLQKNNIPLQKQILIQELKAFSNSSRWKILDCIESQIPNNRKQLNIYAYNTNFSHHEVNFHAFNTAVVSEYFSRGYDTYFITIKSKYSKLTGWGSYAGNILKKARIKNNFDFNNYKGVLNDDLLFFIPKYKLPRKLVSLVNLYDLRKSPSFINNFHRDTNYVYKKKFELRDSNEHRRKTSIVISDSRIIIDNLETDDLIQYIRGNYRKITKYSVKKSKNKIHKYFGSLLKNEFIRIMIYDKDLRKRNLRNSGLSNNLICSISVNNSKTIKTIDIFNGKVEQHKKYRIVWNTNWDNFENVS